MIGRGIPSIRSTLTRNLMVGAGLFIGLTSYLLNAFLTEALNDRFDEAMMDRAEMLTTLTEVDFEGIEFSFSEEFLPDFEDHEGPEFFEIWLPDGEPVAFSPSVVDRGIHVAATFTPEPIFRTIVMPDVGPCRVLHMSFRPTHEDLEIEGTLEVDDPEESMTLLLAQSLEDHRRLLQVMGLSIWGSFTLLLILVVALVHWTIGHGLSPLEDIRARVAAIDGTLRATRISPRRNVAELVPVVDQLNALLARLEAMIDRERRFTSDVAHELRTPLAELRSLAEVAIRDPDDREMVTDFFRDVREITLEMQALVDTLLALARCESDSLEPREERVRLASVVDKSWRRLREVAATREIRLERGNGALGTLLADPTALDQIVHNLIENAVCHSPAGSTVTVEGRPGGLSIANPAPELAPEDLEVMFDRFWQKDSARTGGTHTGLGLALVRALGEQSGVSIRTRLEAGLLEFRLDFPSAFIEN